MLIAFRIAGAYYAGGFVLDLGSVTFPSARYAAFLMTWTAFGTLAALLLCLGMARVALRTGAAEAFVRDFEASSDRRFATVCAAFAFGLALAINVGVLRGARLTDDESAYRFMSELIATGRLYASSHAAPQFFDGTFMINDGRLYAKYFIGWPLLLAPGSAIGLPQLMNPIYFALTVPALYGVLLTLVPIGWARAGTLLMVSAPMLITGAATQLSHTSCMCALAWAYFFALRAGRSRGAPARPLRLRRDVRARRVHPPQLRARHRPAAGLRLASVAALARDAGAVARPVRDGPHRRDRARRADAREPGADRRPIRGSRTRVRASTTPRSAIATRPTRPTTRTRNGATRCGRSPSRPSA